MIMGENYYSEFNLRFYKKKPKVPIDITTITDDRKLKDVQKILSMIDYLIFEEKIKKRVVYNSSPPSAAK